MLAVLLSLALASVLSTIAGAVLGPGSRRGHDVGTIVTAVALSVVAVAATLLPALDTALRRGSVPWLADALTWLPTGWGPVAVQAAARGDWLAVFGSLAGLAVLTLAAADWWPAVLSRRMDAAARPAHAGGARPGRWSALPGTPTGAVTAKEIRMWVRDPIRLTCLLIAVIVGAAVCAIPRLTSGTYLLLPYAGILTAVIAGACACNLYGSDGTSLWLTVMTPDSSRADVRGRQAAWLIVVAPYTVAITIAFTALSGEHAAWPWVLAVLPAVLGGAAGLAPFSSLVSVQPLDETGGPTPAYSLKVHIALVVVALTALVPVASWWPRGLWHRAVAVLGGGAGRSRDRRGPGGLPGRAAVTRLQSGRSASCGCWPTRPARVRVGRLGLAVADSLLDLVAEVLVDVLPVLEGALEDRLGHAVEQVAGDVAGQPVAGGVVHHVADEGAGLAPVVVLGVQLVGAAHDVAVGVPGGRLVVLGVGPRAALGVGRVHRVGHVLHPHRPVLAVAVHRRDRAR